MSEQQPRRRASDHWPSDHDLLIELRRDVANLILRVDNQATEMVKVIGGLRSDHGDQLRDHEHRIDLLEKRADRQDGALGLTHGALAMSFSAGAFLVAVIGLALKIGGHL